MGCTQSKIENEETVARCKDRKQFMKDAVSARNALAEAHFDYTKCLKNTGAALSDYAHGEVRNPHLASDDGSTLADVPQSHFETLRPPPPPEPDYSLQRSASMPEIVIRKSDPKLSVPIIEEENEEEIENESHSLKHRSSRSRRRGGGDGSSSGVSAKKVEDEDLAPPPPPPPRTPPQADPAPPPPPPPESKGATWDYFFPSMENVPAPSLAEVDEGRIGREEIERKMFEERSKRVEIDEGRIEREEIERKMFEERSKRVEVVDGGDGAVKRSVKAEADEVVAEKVAVLPPQPPPPTNAVKKVKQVAPTEGKRGRKGAASTNLLKIFIDLDECFLKASQYGHEVSKMLEANRLHYHSNFVDNGGHTDHSARVMRVITWNSSKSFKGLPKADNGMDGIDSEEHETHATVLDKILAWEKKLYGEVKTGEQMKLEYQRKVASLDKLKKRANNIEAMEKTKAAVSHLHTKYTIDLQSIDATVSEINRLRDEQLYPKLVALVDGMATMWEAMQIHHENQSKIVIALKDLDVSQSPEETSEHHHERTVQLYAVVREWHSQFEKLVTNQKEYIKALYSWLKLNLIPIDINLKEKNVPSPQSPPIQALLRAWNEYLDKIPDGNARTAIFNFAAVVHTIMQYQVEEMKLRDKCEDTRKELSRKARQFDDWHNKYMQRWTPPDQMDPARAQDKDLVAERKLVVDMVNQKLKDGEEAYQKQCIQVREKSLTSLKTQLPEVFRAVLEFSSASSDMYRNLWSISQPHKKPNESS